MINILESLLFPWKWCHLRASWTFQKKWSILSTWYVTIVFLRSRVPPFFSIYFLFLTKLWAVCVQNYTSDDNENNKTKSKIHTVIYPGSSVPLHLFTIFFFPFFSGVQGGVLFRSLLDIKKKSSSILLRYEFSNFVLYQEPLLSSPFISFCDETFSRLF